MKVKQRLKINSVVTIITALLISLVLFLGLHEIKKAVRASELAGELITGAFERSAFRSDYIRSGSERSKKQWFAKHEQIGRLLKSASGIYHDPEDIKTIQNLIKDHETTGGIFSGIVESREMPKPDASSAALAQEREDRLNAQLEMRLYKKILLARMLRESAESRLSYVLALAGMGIICGLIILIAAAIINSWTMGRTIMDRILRLNVGASVIGEGDLDYRIEVKGNDEFAELSDTFNIMSAKLQKSYQDLEKEMETRKQAEEELRKSEERLRLHAENSPTAIIEWSADFIVMRWAGEAEHIFGWSAAETVGKPIMDLGMIYEEDIPIVEQTIGKLTDGVSRKVFSSNRNYTKDGRVIHCEWYNSVLLDADGEMASVMSQVLDVTERKKAEEEVFNLLTELERSNKELEQFAYVASHDLQEPLRMVSSFTQLLAKRYRDKLDQDAMDYIDFAVKGSNRMQRMIQDLLNYSRVFTRGKAPVPTDMDRVLDETLVNLHLAISDSGASITHDALPIVMADHSQLVQVFQNLIGNAIKFRRDDPLHIHVSAGKMGDEWVFSVKDNGMGIEPQYFERIFVLFERLHAGETYRGTGIGLALCKRIIVRIGGRIWVESEPDKGSTFYFTLQGVEQ
jgi:PAS domain S-box-containing protein